MKTVKGEPRLSNEELRDVLTVVAEKLFPPDQGIMPIQAMTDVSRLTSTLIVSMVASFCDDKGNIPSREEANDMMEDMSDNMKRMFSMTYEAAYKARSEMQAEKKDD